MGYHLKRLVGLKSPDTYRFRAITKTGNILHVDVRSTKIMWEGKMAALSVMNDITKQVEFENNLKKEEEKFKMLVESAGDTVAVLQDKKIVFINKRATEYSGYSMDELIGMKFFKIIHPADRVRLLSNYAKRIIGLKVPDTYRFKLLKKNGSSMPVSLKASKIMWDEKAAILIVFTDITQQVIEEDKYLKEKKNNERYLNNSIVFEFNEKGNLLYLNDYGKKFFKNNNSLLKQLVANDDKKLLGIMLSNKRFSSVVNSSKGKIAITINPIKTEGEKRFLGTGILLE